MDDDSQVNTQADCSSFCPTKGGNENISNYDIIMISKRAFALNIKGDKTN